MSPSPYLALYSWGSCGNQARPALEPMTQSIFPGPNFIKLFNGKQIFVLTVAEKCEWAKVCFISNVQEDLIAVRPNGFALLHHSSRVLSKFFKHDHITPVLNQLEWLPVCQRINFKIILLAWKAMNDKASAYQGTSKSQSPICKQTSSDCP